jgi:hypothetical protein
MWYLCFKDLGSVDLLLFLLLFPLMVQAQLCQHQVGSNTKRWMLLFFLHRVVQSPQCKNVWKWKPSDRDLNLWSWWIGDDVRFSICHSLYFYLDILSPQGLDSGTLSELTIWKCFTLSQIYLSSTKFEVLCKLSLIYGSSESGWKQYQY